MQGDMEGRVIEESGSDSDSDSENNWECDVADNPIYFDGIKPKLEVWPRLSNSADILLRSGLCVAAYAGYKACAAV